MNEYSYISINEVLADVTVALGDRDERRLSHGFYKAQVRNAMDELGFSTVFLEGFEDTEIPADHKIVLPAAAYRIKNLHIFKGTPDNITTMSNVYWKKGAHSEGFETGFTANYYPGSNDPYYGNNLRSYGESIYWFIFHGGDIVLSDGCADFDYVRVVYDGIPSGILDEAGLIPPEARKAVVLWTIEKCASFLKVDDSKYRTIQLDAASQLDEYGYNGAWQEAKRRIKYLGKKIRRDVIEYNNRPRA
jgi:hypothetical protein